MLRANISGESLIQLLDKMAGSARQFDSLQTRFNDGHLSAVQEREASLVIRERQVGMKEGYQRVSKGGIKGGY